MCDHPLFLGNGGDPVRFGRLILVVVVSLLVACKLLPGDVDQSPPAATAESVDTDAISRKTDGLAAANGIRPKPRPASLAVGKEDAAAAKAETLAPVEAAPVAPIVEKTNEQTICEKRGGNWSNAGNTGAKTCVKRMRDGGKQCSKASDCTSVCLARSGTCAPVKPLLGCNDILQKDGSRVTLCID